MDLSPDFKEFLQLLNEKYVEYLVVGGYAVAYYGYPRYTGDLDIWIALSSKNADSILQVLKEFGLASLGISKEDLTKPYGIIQIGHPPLRIDLIGSIDGLTFEEATSHAKTAIFDGLPVRFISLPHLRMNKQASARGKDLNDLQNLPEK